MLRHRIATILVLLPLLVWIVAAGGWFFAVAVVLILALAAAEFGLLFRRVGLRPALPLMVVGTAAIALARGAGAFEGAPWLLVALILLSMLWHLVDYERGAPQAGTDFTVTLAGALYVGWIGSYLISLRSMPDGLWWLMVALPSVWLADTGAFFIGKRFGRHAFTPRLSPNKTWEGYLAGVLTGALSGYLLTLLWRVGAGPDSSLTAMRGLELGFVVSLLAPLGDLGVSMIKRQVGAKDSGALLPGHGGALDRIDTWIWSGVLGFAIVSFF